MKTWASADVQQQCSLLKLCPAALLLDDASIASATHSQRLHCYDGSSQTHSEYRLYASQWRAPDVLFDARGAAFAGSHGKDVTALVAGIEERGGRQYAEPVSTGAHRDLSQAPGSLQHLQPPSRIRRLVACCCGVIIGRDCQRRLRLGKQLSKSAQPAEGT